jgi:hypothetical protein
MNVAFALAGRNVAASPRGFPFQEWDGEVPGMNPRPTVWVTTDEMQMQVLRLRSG